MLMQALFSRGGMPIHWNINGFGYTFRRNDDGDFVCPVMSGEHRKMMVQTGNFRIYEPAKKAPEVQSEPEPVVDVSEPDDVADDGDSAPEPEAPASPEAKPRKGGRRKKA